MRFRISKTSTVCKTSPERLCWGMTPDSKVSLPSNIDDSVNPTRSIYNSQKKIVKSAKVHSKLGSQVS